MATLAGQSRHWNLLGKHGSGSGQAGERLFWLCCAEATARLLDTNVLRRLYGLRGGFGVQRTKHAER